MYHTYEIFKESGRSLGTIKAQSAEQAIYRKVGGLWGRNDYVAILVEED